MSHSDEADITLPQVLDYVYQLYEDRKADEFLEAADLLLEQEFLLYRGNSMQLLLFAANCVKDPRDTLDYFQRAQAIYDIWQFHHQDSDIPTLEIRSRQLEALRKVVDREEMEWECQGLMDEGPPDGGTDIEEDNGDWEEEEFEDEESEESAAPHEPFQDLSFRATAMHFLEVCSTDQEQPR